MLKLRNLNNFVRKELKLKNNKIKQSQNYNKNCKHLKISMKRTKEIKQT